MGKLTLCKCSTEVATSITEIALIEKSVMSVLE